MCRHHHGERGHVSCLTGTKGRNKGEFTNLQGVAASSQGKVLIADSNNQCVQVRTNSLKHLRLFSEIIYENYLIFNIVFYFISFYFLTKSRFSPTTASSEVVSASGAGLRVSCSGRQVWPCTPTATSSSQTMTTNGSASFRARASLR